jgi:Domain of unknown function (DUF1707)
MPAATAGRGLLRASDADREQVIDVLKAAYVQGRLSKDELDTRVGQTLASRTYAALAALTADIPTGLIRAQPLRKPARAHGRLPMTAAVKSGAGVIIAAGRRAGSFCLAVGGVSHPEAGSVASKQEAQDRVVGVWGPAAYAWSGEERQRAAGFPIDLSGRQRVLGFPAD